MVALAHAQVGLNTIAQFVHYSVGSVRRWIRRGKATGEIQDHARSGRPALYTEETRLRIVAFYCQTKPLPGCGRWTLEWAVRRLKADPLLRPPFFQA